MNNPLINKKIIHVGTKNISITNGCKVFILL